MTGACEENPRKYIRACFREGRGADWGGEGGRASMSYIRIRSIPKLRHDGEWRPTRWASGVCIHRAFKRNANAVVHIEAQGEKTEMH